MKKISSFFYMIFDKPTEKLRMLAFVITIMLSSVGFCFTFVSNVFFTSGLYGPSINDFIAGIVLGIMTGIIFGVIGYIIGIILCCCADFLDDYHTKSTAIYRMVSSVCDDDTNQNDNQ